MKLGPALVGDHAHGASLDAIGRQAEGCRRCDLYKYAKQLVFGEGPRDARLILVGEQPGDREDIEGRPFVGPAGNLLARCLEEAGIERTECYVTNAVKHFKYEQRGKRRIHSKPNAGEIQSCAWWLGAEIEKIQPEVIVALGATAARTLLGSSVKVIRDRGRAFHAGQEFDVVVTIHPSYLLRIRERDTARREREHFIEDLKTAASLRSQH
ncbi:UdgX family uracil-DNA binding protein [Sinorhizobium alkalisoli]|uniref:Type-4 uracil-DNA glycosylase n=1 Tax=Sinorhizobium alkalisoli TaxID=1752398 RepID=A0A1E3VHZ7_9HYPH|nr:UdgX family uracil-DNA binding protein [Sinorhizobium alkalisoli]MCG5480231.1 UdgX family uracil-DNA binding protein [Sinorhizobium alkalisoli]ODR93219.1 uracil-DNA glycosylase [Sinorhizobium alkalisoli]